MNGLIVDEKRLVVYKVGVRVARGGGYRRGRVRGSGRGGRVDVAFLGKEFHEENHHDEDDHDQHEHDPDPAVARARHAFAQVFVNVL